MAQYECTVTNRATGQEDTYLVSDANWRGELACVRSGEIVHWLPKKLKLGMAIKANGRYWATRKIRGAK